MVWNPATVREAIETLKRAIELNPRDILSHIGIGHGYWEVEREKAGYYYKKRWS